MSLLKKTKPPVPEPEPIPEPTPLDRWRRIRDARDAARGEVRALDEAERRLGELAASEALGEVVDAQELAGAQGVVASGQGLRRKVEQLEARYLIARSDWLSAAIAEARAAMAAGEEAVEALKRRYVQESERWQEETGQPLSQELASAKNTQAEAHTAYIMLRALERGEPEAVERKFEEALG